jgi:photosystem II stability/assembly factor-like uncharacterized protein
MTPFLSTQRALRRRAIAILVGSALVGSPFAAAGASIDEWPTIRPAIRLDAATTAPMAAIARAGARLVAVGDHGVVLLSDDGGRTFRQATSVPVQAMLTSVFFTDAATGVAAGHDGVVIATSDGGESWTLRHDERGQEKPVLAVHMLSAERGLAVGLFGMAQTTEDGGRHWTPFSLGDGDEAERHLYAITRTAKGSLLIFGEAGTIFRSTDQGATWTTLRTGDKASLWAGLRLRDGTVLASGMRGRLFRSLDDGLSWSRVETGSVEALTGLTQGVDGAVVAVGFGGGILVSQDDGRRFFPLADGHPPMTAVTVNREGEPVAAGIAGVVGLVTSSSGKGR